MSFDGSERKKERKKESKSDGQMLAISSTHFINQIIVNTKGIKSKIQRLGLEYATLIKV
jgi:hypothetical protein